MRPIQFSPPFLYISKIVFELGHGNKANDDEQEEWDKIFQANNNLDIGSKWHLDSSGLTFGPTF